MEAKLLILRNALRSLESDVQKTHLELCVMKDARGMLDVNELNYYDHAIVDLSNSIDNFDHLLSSLESRMESII
jgi:hypothetical protein